MTTQFDSKHDAITTGLYYEGRKDLSHDGEGKIKSLEEILKDPEIKIVDGNISQFGYVHEDTIMIEFKNSKDVLVKIATTKFRDGFDLWFIEPDSGAGMRV